MKGTFNVSETPKNTYHEQARHDAEQPQGRWQRHSPVTVTGSGTADPLPAPVWSQEGALLGDEPTINFEADSALPSMETASGLPREPQP